MNLILPASPSWNISRIFDADNEGMICFGSRNNVYIWDLSEALSTCPTFVVNHQSKVVSVNICSSQRSENVYKICSASSDGWVKVIQFKFGEESQLIAEHSSHKHNILAVHSSLSDPNKIASGDDRGTVIIWDYSSNTTISWGSQHIENAVISLAFSPNGKFIAVGLKMGDIILLELTKKSLVVIHKLKGHSAEVQSLHWISSPESGDGKCAKLLSGGRDSTIRFWNVECGKVEKVLNVESHEVRQKKFLALAACSWSHNEILCSNSSGDILLWNMEDAKPRCKLVPEMKGHNRNKAVFNIVTWVMKDGSKRAASFSMDRQITIWDLDKRTFSSSLPTLGGFVYSISQSPISRDVIAIGVGDCMIRTFAIRNNTCSNFQTYKDNINSKVMTLSWHPHNERMLAFGTEDGNVGVIRDVASKSGSNTEISSTFHKRPVYSLAWAPRLGSRNKNDFALYSVGNFQIFIHNLTSLKEEAVDLDDVIRKKNPNHVSSNRTEICFSPEFQYFAVGNDNGSVDVYETESTLLVCRLHHCKKLINCISWHPDVTSESLSRSTCRNWIAVATNSCAIYIFNLENVFSHWRTNQTSLTVTDCLMTLQGHSQRILRVMWSPDRDGLLVSASSDWTVQVWNVPENKGIANYRGHWGHVLSLSWGAEEGSVYSGGEDFTFQAWKFTQLKHTMPPKGKGQKTKTLPMHPTSTKVVQESKNPVVVSTEVNNVRRGGIDVNEDKNSEVETVVKNCENNCNSSLCSQENSVLEDCEEKEEWRPSTKNYFVQQESMKYKKATNPAPVKKKPKSLFPLSSAIENSNKIKNQLDCIQLSSALFSAGSRKQTVPDHSFHLGCYVDRKQTHNLFITEVNHHDDVSNFEGHVTLDILRGADGSYLRELAKAHKLTDHFVAMAPSISFELWEELCVEYSNQLVEEYQYQKASTYLIAVGKIADAIKLLLNAKLYREAVCLARVRLHSSDPLLISTYISAAEAAAQNGNFELSAKCFLAAKKVDAAISMILRRSEPFASRVASLVSMETGNAESSLAHANSYVNEMLHVCDWSSAKELLMSLAGSEHLSLIVCSHEVLISFLDISIPGFDDLVECRKLNETSNKMETYITDSDGISSFLVLIMEKWIHEWQNVSERKNDLKLMYDRLFNIHHTRQPKQDLKNSLIDACFCISLFILECLLEADQSTDIEKVSNWLVEALIKIEPHDNVSLLNLNFCCFLFPRGPWRINEIISDIKKFFSSFGQHDHSVLKSSRQNVENSCKSFKNLFALSVVEMADMIESSIPGEVNKEICHDLLTSKSLSLQDCLNARYSRHLLQALHFVCAKHSSLQCNVDTSAEQTSADKEHSLEQNANINICSTLEKLSSILLHEELLKMQRLLKIIEEIEVSCREMIAKGGCFEVENKSPEERNCESQKTCSRLIGSGDCLESDGIKLSGGSEDSNEKGCKSAQELENESKKSSKSAQELENGGGDGSEHHKDLDSNNQILPSKKSLKHLADQMSKCRKRLAEFPDFYKKFPSCFESIKLMRDVSDYFCMSDKLVNFKLYLNMWTDKLKCDDELINGHL